MRLRFFYTPWFCALWSFLSLYAGIIYLAAIAPGGGHSDVIAPSPLGLALVLGWLPAGVGAAGVALFVWLAKRFLPPAWVAAGVLPLLAALAVWPFVYHYYQTHYSDAAQYRAAYNEAMQVGPGGLAQYMAGGAWQTRREAFLENYGLRYTGRPPLDPQDIPVVERILDEKFAESPDLRQSLSPFRGPPGVYTLFGDLVAARLGSQSLVELFAHWPPRLLVDALFAPQGLQKLDTLTLSAADAAVLYEQSAAAAAAQDLYGAYGLVWLDLRQWQPGIMAKAFGRCAVPQHNQEFCLRFAVEQIMSRWRPQIAAVAALHSDDVAALTQLLNEYFDAPRKFMQAEIATTLFRWLVLDALTIRPLSEVLDAWPAQQTELLKVLLSAPVLSRLQAQADWPTEGRAALRQVLMELPEPPRPKTLRYDDFYGVWMPWMNAQLDLLRPGRLQELFALCRRLPVEREQRLTCFRYVFDNLKGRQDYAGMHLADDAEHRGDFAALAQAVEELPQLTGHKGMHFDARLALYQLRKALLRPGETPELLAAAQSLDESGGYGFTYRMQTLQWLMAEGQADPPRYRPDSSDRAAITAAAEDIGSQFKAQVDRAHNDPEAAMALGDAPQKAFLDSQAILVWIRGD